MTKIIGLGKRRGRTPGAPIPGNALSASRDNFLRDNCQLGQVHAWNSVLPAEDGDRQPAICLYVDGALYVDDSRFPDELDLRTIPVRRCSRTSLYALMPFSRGPNGSSPDTVAHPLGTCCTHSNLGLGPVDVPIHHPNTSLAQKASSVKRNKTHPRLCLRNKRSRSRLVPSPGKRLKSGSRHRSEAKTSSDANHHPASEAVSNELALADAGTDDDSEDGDAWGVVSEEDAEDIRLGDRERITAFFRMTADYLGQTLLKGILRAWVKLLEPGKSTKFPYNGGSKGDRRSNEFRNPGRHTAPPWWPKQAGWQQGFGCRHREPDHIFKSERLLLTPCILRLTRTDGVNGPEPRDFPVARLREVTDQITMTTEQRKLLQQLYRLREDEQAYEDGAKDANDVTYLRRIRPQIGKGKKRKAAQVTPEVEEVERERVGSPESLEQLVAAQTSMSPTASRDPSFDSTLNPDSIKSEQQTPQADYTGPIPAPLPQYTGAFRTEDMFNPGEPFPLDATAELRTIYAGSNQLREVQDGYTPAVLNPPDLFSQAAGVNGCAMAEPSLYPSTDAEHRSRTSMRLDNAHCMPRPSSVQKQPSSSWNVWPALPESQHQWNFTDDMTLRLKQPRQSDGRPNIPPDGPLFGPGSHPHGLAVEQQLPLCVANNCIYSHTHGWRPLDEQLRICAAYRCTTHPSEMPCVYIDPRDTRFHAPDGLFLNPYFDECHATGDQAFDVTKSFP
ncbi:MAG: hypothetical protein Q9207_007729 [Kuettlingeria erythrocarpa]